MQGPCGQNATKTHAKMGPTGGAGESADGQGTGRERAGSGRGEFKEHHLVPRGPQAAPLIKITTNYSARMRDLTRRWAEGPANL